MNAIFQKSEIGHRTTENGNPTKKVNPPRLISLWAYRVDRRQISHVFDRRQIGRPAQGQTSQFSTGDA